MAAELDLDSPVCGSVREMLEVHGHGETVSEEGEYCSVCDEGCEAPAGHLYGGVIVDGTEFADFTCCECWEPVCGSCSESQGGERVCDSCIDREREEDE